MQTGGGSAGPLLRSKPAQDCGDDGGLLEITPTPALILPSSSPATLHLLWITSGSFKQRYCSEQDPGETALPALTQERPATGAAGHLLCSSYSVCS